MKTIRITKIAFLFGILSNIMTSCSTHVVDEPRLPEVNGDESITLFLTGKDIQSTRADASHKLRFTAKLYSGDLKDKNGVNPIKYQETKQAIAENGQNTIIFKKPEGVYTIFLFADYIPITATPNSNGLYEDCYYATNFDNDKTEIQMLIPGNGTTILNNDNMDCFAGVVRVEKKEEEFKRTIALERAVARVSFLSRTDAPAEVDYITIGGISLFDKFAWTAINDGSNDVYPPFNAGAMTYPDAEAYCRRAQIGVSPNGNNEVFFFYTFANDEPDRYTEALATMSFTVNYKEVNGEKVAPRTTKIESGTGNPVKVLRNHKTIVKGDFFQSDKSKLGDIILNLSPNILWDTDIDIII